MKKMSSELALIKEIKKFPFLYDFTLPDYTRKEAIRRAWTTISVKLKTPVHDCKEKWRNIRSSLLRSLKPSPQGSRPKKPYYLKKDLRFIMPFVRPMKNTPVKQSEISETGETSSENDDPLDNFEPDLDSNENDSEDVKTNLILSPQDNSRLDQDELLRMGEPSVLATAVLGSENTTSPSTQQRRVTTQSRIAKLHRRRAGLLNTNKTLEKTLNAYFKAKIRRIESVPSAAPTMTSFQPSLSSSTGETGDNSLRLFLTSLLPDLETMSADQIRTFKIKVMVLIDKMKSDGRNGLTSSHQPLHQPESSSIPSSSVESSQPQKTVKEEFVFGLGDEDSSNSL